MISTVNAIDYVLMIKKQKKMAWGPIFRHNPFRTRHQCSVLLIQGRKVTLDSGFASTYTFFRKRCLRALVCVSVRTTLETGHGSTCCLTPLEFICATFSLTGSRLLLCACVHLRVCSPTCGVSLPGTGPDRKQNNTVLSNHKINKSWGCGA